MKHGLDPLIDEWYAHVDKGRQFRVVAIDDETSAIEIQYFDGDLDAIDPVDWNSMPLERIEPPEDWTGPVDDVEYDELNLSDDAMRESDWVEPLDEYPSTDDTERPQDEEALTFENPRERTP